MVKLPRKLKKAFKDCELWTCNAEIIEFKTNPRYTIYQPYLFEGVKVKDGIKVNKWHIKVLNKLILELHAKRELTYKMINDYIFRV